MCNLARLQKKNEIKYFKETIISKVESIPNNFDDIDKIVDYILNVEVEDYKLLEQDKSISNEGQILLNHELLVNLKFKEKISYNTTNNSSAVNILFSEFFKGIIIVLPDSVHNKNIKDIIRSNRFTINLDIEYKMCRNIDFRNIHKSILFLANIIFC